MSRSNTAPFAPASSSSAPCNGSLYTASRLQPFALCYSMVLLRLQAALPLPSCSWPRPFSSFPTPIYLDAGTFETNSLPYPSPKNQDFKHINIIHILKISHPNSASIISTNNSVFHCLKRNLLCHIQTCNSNRVNRTAKKKIRFCLEKQNTISSRDHQLSYEKPSHFAKS